MKLAMSTAIALVVGALSLCDASAGTISMPSPPASSMLLAAADQEMTVSNNYGYANLRQKPASSAKLLDKLPEGTKVIVIQKVSGGTWVHVKIGNKDGYIQAKLLK